MKYPEDYINKVILGDCLEVMKGIPDKSIDLVLTDPPYPDYFQEEYQYKEGILNYLKTFDCRQIIFWTAKDNFPLNHTAIHIWDKKVGAGSWYERIFERNGGKEYKVFRHYLINSDVAAKFTRDTNFPHPSQKPLALIRELVSIFSNEGDIILDPFLGSGTTAVACKQLNRNFIGIEISEKYCEIARKRLEQEQLF